MAWGGLHRINPGPLNQAFQFLRSKLFSGGFPTASRSLSLGNHESDQDMVDI